MTPALSVVVVAYDMPRELPRTLRSLGASYQRGVDRDDYEVIVVDNGSPDAVEDQLPRSVRDTLRVIRLDPAPPSPARAANLGIERARGDLIGLIVDGARMASPGLLANALRARVLAERPIVATTGYHLGTVRHGDSAAADTSQADEDRLLDEINWEADGYRLFSVSTLADSSARGWFGPMGESSALFLPRSLWDELSGLDESFAMPGGGLVNHDLYRRACSLPDTELIVLLGEGTFHQRHGGSSTSGLVAWDEMQADYETQRGKRFRPLARDAAYVGRVPPSSLDHLSESVQWLQDRIAGGAGDLGRG